MVRDLDLPIEVLGCPIAREPDGLAMSSRNRYLDAAQRAHATAISRSLQRADEAFRSGERSPARLEAIVRAQLEAEVDAIEYASVVDAETLRPFAADIAADAVLLIVARLGSTRLLDNRILGRE
jgi:pantoate--beta-alanine ligase